MRIRPFVFLCFAFLFFAFSIYAPITHAQESASVTVHVFTADGCPHCMKEKVFLASLSGKMPGVEVVEYEVTKSQSNVALLQAVAQTLGVNVQGVPFTVIGTQHIMGYGSDETTGNAIVQAIETARISGQSDVVAETARALNPTAAKPVTDDSKSASPYPDSIAVPIFGTLSLKGLSLPAITIVIAAIDGFNPCAMWTLIFLISLLIGMQDKKRMWIYGFTFIAASAFVYFLFLSAWLNLFLFLGFIGIIRIGVGVVALVGGGLNLREYILKKDASCKVTNVKERKHFFEKMKEATQQQSFIIALGAIIVLAFAVNLVELICSAGLPAVYTQILALSDLPTWKYYAYLLLYIFIFMLDDLFVFVVSMKTLHLAGVTTKYARFSHLVGGVVTLLVGILLIFRPDLLMFG